MVKKFENHNMIRLYPNLCNNKVCYFGTALVIVTCDPLTLYLIETPFNAFANRADPDQAALELPDQDLLCLLMEI